jgi:hypothetical protein
VLHNRDRLESASLCGTCHDIENDHGTHIERTFEEWQETIFSQAEVGTTCGQCHMDQSTNLEPIANAPGVFSRRLHSHRFPGVDLPLQPTAGEEELREAVQSFLDTSLQSALCVRGAPTGSQIQVVLDNVAAGHRWPSGSAQDRRAWVEVKAYAGGQLVFQSGAVPEGTSVTLLEDPNLWLIRDCMLDAQGQEVHMFWEAEDYETNLLPGQFTFDPRDPRYYQTHVFQAYPRDGSLLSVYPERVTMQVYLQPFGLDVFDEIVAGGDLVESAGSSSDGLRAKLVPLAVGAPVEWTPAAVSERYLEAGLPVECVSTTNLSAAADKVAAVNHQRCRP